MGNNGKVQIGIYIHLVRINKISVFEPNLDGGRGTRSDMCVRHYPSVLSVDQKTSPTPGSLLFASKGTGTAALIRTV